MPRYYLAYKNNRKSWDIYRSHDKVIIKNSPYSRVTHFIKLGMLIKIPNKESIPDAVLLIELAIPLSQVEEILNAGIPSD